MRRFRNSRFARSALLPLTLLIWLTACQKTVIHTSPFEELAREKPGGTVTLVFADGTTRNVRAPRITTDSLFGVVYHPRTRAYTDTIGYALAEIHSVEQTKTPTAGKVVLIVTGVAFVAGFVALLTACDDRPAGKCFGP